MLFYMCNIMGIDYYFVCYFFYYILYSIEKDIFICYECKLELIRELLCGFFYLKWF